MRKARLPYRKHSADELATMIRHSLSRAWQLIIIVVGGTFLLVGIALLILPGPGWLTIIVGLGILGSEFLWARRLLRKVREEIKEAERFIKREVRAQFS